MPGFLFWNEIVIPLAGMATGLIITLSIVRAVALHLERRHDARLGGGAAADTESLRTEVQQLRAQLESLEERVDFAERLLTRARDDPRLPGAGGPRA